MPTGIFYAQGVKTNVLFFNRGAANKDTGNTERVWVYDLRTNMPSFGKRTPLTRAHFADFERVFGDDPDGGAPRSDQGERGRFRCFTREAVRARGDNLDVAWLRDEAESHNDARREPDELAAEILARLRDAMEEMEALSELMASSEQEDEEAIA
jgi:type I restriction enzyme M protein